MNPVLAQDILDLSVMDIVSLSDLCQKIRHRILEVVSTNGGHLSSTLGAVELIVAMHKVFDCKENPFIYDVSHQAYAHKLLTNRWKSFDTLRQFEGMSGFIKPSESEFDYFVAGHSSTSISIGVGVAKAFALQGKSGIPIALIGDGSMSAGLVYEALNELGDRKYPMIIILNDNEMSIAKPIGAISKYLSHLIAGPMYQSVKDRIKKLLDKMPDSATYIAKRFEESFKLITPGILFEEMGINYIGPINGHHLEEIIHALNLAKDMRCPVIIHAQTIKGKGYEIAEGKYEKWHGVGPFHIDTGKSKKFASTQSPTDIYSQTLLELADEDEKIVGVTAAMPGGTGLGVLIDKYPNRFWDVAIAEQHAVTSMAALAKEGFKPFVSIYSTFLQRAYDQIVHDVGIMSLPVKFAIDRAGIVGEDGETHQGLLDISFLRSIPNMVLFAPYDNPSLKKAILFASNYSSSPCAFRYPRGKFVMNDGIFEDKDFIIGKSELLIKDGSILLIGYGNGVGRAYEVYLLLKEKGIKASLLDLRFLKPLDKDLKNIMSSYSHGFVFSDSYRMGGVGSALLEYIAENDMQIKLHSFEVMDSYIPQGNTPIVEKSIGLDSQGCAIRIMKMFDECCKNSQS
ncbi:1-deoxy-D-xylulose-5-phosphate synthase [Helicobacter sp. 13S00482-2]|uniref:1-deoxy-D-xylulose-5-phosphate synthase n=1 Tax=Helicobacter sp. 13S00482-2 TaxID=1476200 RepID=UPI000BA66CA8|nr:1-deoxy-D-xylulose-5-phosphate synthase [Helicobacter sp. 13S00482-2]PAF54271.1 1-deoxy-D-xylulose-5-phosphate synthase [Helicobacter sp. 13S00482-2]